MRRKDDYAGDERARDGLTALTGRAPSESMRVELERAALDAALLPHLKSKGYTTRLYRFGDTLDPMPDVSALTGRGHATHIGDALQAAVATHRGRHVTDMVIVSDGRNNGGLPALEAARAAAAAGIPVHTLVVGDTRPEKNLVIELVEAPTSVLDGDEIAVSVRVLARGIAGGGQARVVLEEVPADGSAVRPVAEADVEMDEKGSKAVLIAPPETPEGNTNERRLRVRVEPLPEETLKDDNAVSFSVRINPEKIRVLYVDGYPRYEYRFLKELLKRSDANIDVQVFLLSATPDFVQESTKGLPPLTSVPTGRKELLENYDVVILGDVNPYAISPDPARCEEFMASLREFVERGGGAMFIAGEHDDPLDYVGTPLGELLPIVADATTRNIGAEFGEGFPSARRGRGDAPRGRAPGRRAEAEPRAVGGRGRPVRLLLVLPGRAREAGRAGAAAAPDREQRSRTLSSARHGLFPGRPHAVQRGRRDVALALPLR
jgi:hypothetical protein